MQLAEDAMEMATALLAQDAETRPVVATRGTPIAWWFIVENPH